MNQFAGNFRASFVASRSATTMQTISQTSDRFVIQMQSDLPISRIHCPFYQKIGACRFGERICARFHDKPRSSVTLLFANYYQSSDENDQQQLETFYQKIYEDFGKFGEIDTIIVCGNINHLKGHVYCKYKNIESAQKAFEAYSGTTTALGRPIIVEYSPVTDFQEATCRQYENGDCNRGGYCNFIHWKKSTRDQTKQLNQKLESVEAT